MIILYIVHFCRYFLQASSTEEILKSQIKDCFKINDKKRIIMPGKGEYIKFKNYKRKIQPMFIIYEDFKSILAQKNNEKQNPEQSYKKKYQKNIVCSYGYIYIYIYINIYISIC